ncbi:aminoglycoside phosphotransferase family protein [Oceanobacillus luteolus]|uniref:Phosphotransferase family protein n=1 Tax=Oceanobacillus luteolus TaxID=1274358 RepID=A0ABW4HNQ6_9BACI|nr:aminoglycoside phosphotransferase family protein [Oceanobacillus luteolus]MCM3740538.1 aminoglycoside phosphotransferase family protein [Oceanobacillus luteolus]
MLTQVIKQFGLQITNIDEVDDSHSSMVYKCRLPESDHVYIKIPYTTLKYQRELEAYQILQDNIPIPKLLDYWPGDEEIPGAFLLSELEGRPLSARDSRSIAYQVGVIHAQMHNIPPPAHLLAGIQNEFPNWSSFIDKQFHSFAQDVKTVLDESTYHLALEKFENIKSQLPEPDGPSFVHMDFRPANIIVDNDKVTGIIDFESVRFGSTEIDFTKLYRDFLSYDISLLENYKTGYSSVRPLIDLEAVLPFYRFTDAFNSIGWSIRRGIEKNKHFFEANVTMLNHFLKKN